MSSDLIDISRMHWGLLTRFKLRALPRLALSCALMQTLAAAHAATSAAPSPSASPSAAPPAQNLPEFYIHEYRVTGAHHLTPLEIENAVYPYLGPGRTAQDVEGARAALAKVYEDKSYTSINVTIPPQTGARGIVFLLVNEMPVGRLRVEGSRFHDINLIKQAVPSLAEGKLIDFAEAQKELVGLSQLPDRRITPVIQAGVVPGTMDVDLNVKDTLPLHGSLELNNRYSADTPSLRLDASLSYDNLWQLGHSIGGSAQVSPQDFSKVQVFTGFYTFRFPGLENFSLTLQGTEQNSNVSTLGSIDVTGKGQIAGLRANFKLPTVGDYFHNFTFGLDYKALEQDVTFNPVTGAAVTTTTLTKTPTTYVPLTFDYSGTVVGQNFLTDLDVQVVLGLRGIGSNASQFDHNRFSADRNFIYLRGDVAQTEDLPYDLQLFAKLAGQVADSPLINSEQFSVGGLDTVRGYLESSVLGDDAVVANFEFRGPSLVSWLKTPAGAKSGNDWRFYLFTDAAAVSIQDPLPGQAVRYSLASYGGGTRMTLFNDFNASLDLAVPLFNQAPTKAQNPFLTFRVWTDF
jgi:hemolysin activation/secretion protein